MKHRLKRGLAVTFLGLAVNTLLAAVKLVAGVVGHSHALVADAVESFADLCSSLVVWRGLVVASVPADANHPYGHGKAEAVSAAVVAAMLVLAAMWIAVQSVREIAAPHLAPKAFTLFVLLGVVLVKEALFRYALRTGTELDSAAVRSDAWHHRSDAITSVAAGVGITVALVGGEGYAVADDVAALFASAIIFWNGWRILRPALDELMDASAAPDLIQRIRATAESVPGAAHVEKCLVRRMGPRVLVDMHLEVASDMTVRGAHDLAHQVKDAVCAAHPLVQDVLVHVEPLREAPPVTTG